VYVFCFLQFFLDEITEYIDEGGFAFVYKCVSKDTNTEMAVKVYKVTTLESISRDIKIGFNKNLDSEYTLNYRDKFTIEINKETFQGVVMDLFDCSLRKYLLNQNGKLLSDEV
jgi:serine/threonine protein kinase